MRAPDAVRAPPRATVPRPAVVAGRPAGRRGLPPRSLTALVCVVFGGLAFALALYPLTLPNALLGVHPAPHGYDDGVYLGVATRLVHGVLPYRDFAFLQPPGMVIVMTPAALLGRIFGTDVSLGAARLFTAAVMGANPVLVALALRRRGLLAMALGAGALACYPLSVAASGQDDLEPYLVMFAMAAVALAFSARPSRRRLTVAGVLVGFAAAVKLPAAALALVLLACLAPDWRRLRAAGLGCAAGFLLPCAAFFAAAPGAALHETLVVQLSRMDPDVLSLGARLVLISGIGGVANVAGRAGTAEALVLGFVLIVGTVFVLGRSRLRRLDVFALGAAAVVVGELLVAHEFYDHYAYLPAAFCALLLGDAAGLIAALLAGWADGRARRRLLAGLAATSGVLAVALVAFGLRHVVSFEHGYLAGSTSPAALVDAAVPAGACVVTDEETIVLAADRAVPARSGCPGVVDAYGMFLLEDFGYPPPGSGVPPAFADLWRADMAKADAVVLSVGASPYVAWDPATTAWFDRHFRLVASEVNADVYLPVAAVHEAGHGPPARAGAARGGTLNP